jgi:hypothetical protein
MPPGGGGEMRIQRPSRAGAWMAALALAVVLPACGGGGGGGTAPTTQPPAPAPVRTLVDNRNFTVGGFPEVVTLPITVTGNGTGTVEIVADWTFASSDIDIVWYAGTCSPAAATARSCTVIGATTSATQKPERLTISNVGAGSYTVGIANFSDRSESGNAQVYFTR